MHAWPCGKQAAPPGPSTAGGFRSDAAEWPGGGVGAYLDRVFTEVLPWVQAAYGAATDPARIAFGGSSFGGICTLCACMRHGDRIGAALVESPSLWFADERFLRWACLRRMRRWRLRARRAAQRGPPLGFAGTRGMGAGTLLARCSHEGASDRAAPGEGPLVQPGAAGVGRTVPALPTPAWRLSSGSLPAQVALPPCPRRACREDLASYSGPWPQRLFMAMGSREFTGTRPQAAQAGGARWDALLARYCEELAALLGEQGLGSDRLKWEVSSRAARGWGAASRRPALRSCYQPASNCAACQVGCQPANWPACLPASACRRTSNYPPTPPTCPPWQIGEGAAHTESAWAERLPSALRFLLAPWWADDAAAHAEHLFFTSLRRLQAGQPATLFVNAARSTPLAGAAAPLQLRYGFNNWSLGAEEAALAPAPQLAAAAQHAQHGVGSWQSHSFVVPHKAYEMQFVLTDGRHWDNNAGVGLGAGRAGSLQQRAWSCGSHGAAAFPAHPWRSAGCRSWPPPAPAQVPTSISASRCRRRARRAACRPRRRWRRPLPPPRAHLTRRGRCLLVAAWSRHPQTHRLFPLPARCQLL